MISKKIFIEYKVNGSLSDAYSVTLDSSYGIKKQNGTVVSVNGTSVLNSSTGVYEYELSAEEGVVYLVSWEIVPSTGSQPVYTTQSIGPFYATTTTSVRSVSDVRGTLVQGSTSTLFLTITDVHGNALTAESIDLTISKNETLVVDSVSPDFIKLGFYAFDWTVPSDLETGEYIATWTYTVDGISISEIQKFVISSSGDIENSDIQFYGSRLGDLRIALTEMIACAQKIPVYHEQALADVENKKFKLTFPRWNQAYGTRVYRNNKLVQGSYEINYFKGTVIFDTPVSEYDMIHADYNFRWFEDSQLDRFLHNAVSVANFYPPQSGYNILTLPDLYIPLVLYGAAKDAIRDLLMCLNFQQPQQVFGGADAAQKAFSNLETLKKNYEEEFTRLLEQKKYGKYPRVRGIVTPEFTLPGGRSRWFRYMFGGGT